jgi:hypothetical protein
MKKLILGLLLASALGGCSTISALENASLTTTQVYVVANAFDAAELTATNYLSLPACTTGGTPVCRNPPAVAALVAAVRGGYKARQALVSACAASITAANCVSAYTTVTTAVSGLQTIFSQYAITKGS